MTESDKKAVEELLGLWPMFAGYPKVRDFMLETRQEAKEDERKRILDLPCMQYDETKYGQHDDKNDLRREIRDALNKK